MHRISRIASPLRFAASLALVAVSAGAIAAAQSNSINGTLRGQVTDASGAPVPNADVTVKNGENGYTRDLKTGSDGRYRRARSAARHILHYRELHFLCTAHTKQYSRGRGHRSHRG